METIKAARPLPPLSLPKLLAGNPDLRRLLREHLMARQAALLQRLVAAPNWDAVNVMKGSLAENEVLLAALDAPATKENDNAD